MLIKLVIISITTWLLLFKQGTSEIIQIRYLSRLAGKFSLRASFLFAILFSLIGEAASSRCDKTLTVHLDLHAPSAYLDSNGQVVGMDALLAQRILTQAGCKVRWHTTSMTGERILRSLQQGKFDVMIRASKTVQRQEYAYFSDPYRDEVVGMFSRKQLKLPSTFSMVDVLARKLRVIGPVSGWYGDEFEMLRSKWKKEGYYTAYPDAKHATDLLFIEPSRGHLLIVDADIFYFHLGKERYDQVKLVGKNLHISPALLMFNQKSLEKNDLIAINQAILLLQQTGELKAIENNHRPQSLQKLLKANTPLL
jgi:polar amino acid transport system substrate-binding protein